MSGHASTGKNNLGTSGIERSEIESVAPDERADTMTMENIERILTGTRERKFNVDKYFEDD